MGTLANKKCVAAPSASTVFFAALHDPPSSFSCGVSYVNGGAITLTGETTLCCRQP